VGRLRSGRAHHPLAPLWRRRAAHLLRLLAPPDRTLVALLPVLLGARFRRPGFDKEPPGLDRQPRRRRWGRACEAIDFPPPPGFCTTRPLIRSALLIASGSAFQLVLLVVSDRTLEEDRRLDERVQMLQKLMHRRSSALTLVVEEADTLPTERLLCAALVAGDLPALDADAPLDPLQAHRHAPTPFARTLALAIADRPPFERLLPGLALAHPDRFAAAATPDHRLLELVCQLGHEPSLVELQLASRIVRQSALERWRKRDAAGRRALAPLIRAELLGARVLKALRPLLEKLTTAQRPIERQHEGRWHLELDGTTLVSSPSLDGLRAAAITETTQLVAAGPEWRRARALLDDRTPRTLVVAEPGFLKHLIISVGPTGRLRARRLTTDGCVRLAVAIRSRGRVLEIASRPGADPLLVSRLSQIAAADGAFALGVQHHGRLLLGVRGAVRDLPLYLALSRPRRLTLLPEQPEWLPAMRPPRSGALTTSVHATLFSTGDAQVDAVYVDASGRVLLERLPRQGLEGWVHDTRALLEARKSALSLTVSPALGSLSGRRPVEDVAPLELGVVVHPAGLTLTLGDDRFGYGAPLGYRALAEAVFSHWPPQQRGRVRLSAIEWTRQGADVSALDVLAVRARVMRRLFAQLASLGRSLEAA